MSERHFRHEYKHEISYGDMLCIKQNLSAVAQLDSNAINGSYKIRSLYFDNVYDQALREKLDGVDHREKFRLRYYNDDPTAVIHLEKKSKQNGLCNKIMTEVSVEEAQRIVDGDVDWMRKDKRALLVELYSKMNAEGLRPKTIVDYERIPYIYGPGNVRVTLDYDIRTGLRAVDFLDTQILMVPVMMEQAAILEVKWDEFLPDIIRTACGLRSRRAGAYSKYAASRMFD